MPHDIDKLNQIIAFRMGYRYGKDVGPASPNDAEREITNAPVSFKPDVSLIECFCNGSDDGAKGDGFRYVLSYQYL